MIEDGDNINPLLAGLNPNAAPFNMDSLIATADCIQRECRLPDFVIEKPEAWLKCVEVQLEDAKVGKSKEKYNKMLGKLTVHIIEELAPVTDNPSLFEDLYTELKHHLLAAYGRSKWEKLDSLLSFPKMGAKEWSLVVLVRLNMLFMAIYLRVLPDGYCEHFSWCQFKSAEKLVAVTDGLWEMRGATQPSWRLWAVLPPLGDSSRRSANSSSSTAEAATTGVGDRRSRNNNSSRGGYNSGSGRRDRFPTPGGALQNDGSSSSKLPIPAVNTIHTFSAKPKLCFMSDRL
jgi:hypothetical protein